MTGNPYFFCLVWQRWELPLDSTFPKGQGSRGSLGEGGSSSPSDSVLGGGGGATHHITIYHVIKRQVTLQGPW